MTDPFCPACPQPSALRSVPPSLMLAAPLIRCDECHGIWVDHRTVAAGRVAVDVAGTVAHTGAPVTDALVIAGEAAASTGEAVAEAASASAEAVLEVIAAIFS